MGDLDEVRSSLVAAPRPLDALREVPALGIYAWWGSVPFPADFPEFDPAGPVYVGIAVRETLGQRTADFHLSRTRGSSLRRSMAALLADQLDLWPELLPSRRHFGLTNAGELRLTAWMRDHLHVTWVEHPEPGPLERALIAELTPPLNDTHAPKSSAYRAPMRRLRSAMRTASQR